MPQDIEHRYRSRYVSLEISDNSSSTLSSNFLRSELLLFIINSNKMLEDSSDFCDFYAYFSRPELLQELRSNLAGLIHHDRTALQELVDSLQGQISAQQPSAGSPPCECCPRWREAAAAVSGELRERSASLGSIGLLTIRLIDFICEEAARHSAEVQELQGQADRLQDAVEEATSRNAHIENDVMVFREQLEAAREELEEIAEERQEQAEDVAQEWSAERDLKIQTLERELEKMRSQLIDFKASAMSKASLGCQLGLPLRNAPQTSSLCLLQKSPRGQWVEDRTSEEDAILRFSSQNRALEEENQRLKMEIDVLKKSTAQFVNIEEDLAQSPISRALLRVRTSSKTIQAHPPSPCSQPPFDFHHFLSLFRSKREERLNSLVHEGEGWNERAFAREASRAELNSEAVPLQTLNSQWSRSSLTTHNAQPLLSELILLTQESEEGPVFEKGESGFFRNVPNSLEKNEIDFSLKETEPSLNESSSANPTRMSMRCCKSVESIGINTIQHEKQQASKRQEGQEGCLFGSRMIKKLAGYAIVSSLTDFVVNRRVKRRSHLANSGTATILI